MDYRPNGCRPEARATDPLDETLFAPLPPPLLLQYLNPASLHDPSLGDAEQYNELQRSMDSVGLSAAEKANLFRVVAAVLHLGNIGFLENTKDKKGS